MANYNDIHENLNTALETAEDKGYNAAMEQALFWVCRMSGHSPKEYDNHPDWGSAFEAACTINKPYSTPFQYKRKEEISMEKTCTKCGKTLDITMFSKHCKSKDGYRTYCKECAKAYQSKWYTDNREEENASRRSKYDSVKESERYNSRREAILLKKKEWRANNKDKQTLQSERRRARETSTSSSLTQEEWEYIKAHFENKCAYCGKDLSLERDHVVALTKGGGLEYGNIVPACKSCNSSKGNKDLLSWYRNKSYWSQEREDKVLNFIS